MSRGLIGREAELAEVETFLDGVVAGSHLEIEGEVGIGKTALWSEACERALRRGFRVLVSCPGELETGLGYSALGDLLEDVLDEALLTVAPPRCRALERALVRVEDVGEPPEPRAVSLALRDALRSLGVEPLVVAIDDVQWLDRSSRAALPFALRRVGDARIGALTTRRAGENAAQALPVGRSIVVGSLDEPDIDDLVWTTLGAPLPRHTLHELYRVSEGNPFFALELAREALRRDGDGHGTGALAVPSSLRALLGNRVAELPADVREALLVVAAASQPTVSLVEAVLGSRQQAYDVLAGAAAAEILQVERGRLRFRHPLLASAVYGDAARDKRRRVHVALAEATDDVEERAHHLARATDLPDPAVAGVLDAAAARALARGAPAAAARFAEQALRLTRVEDRDVVAQRTATAADALWTAGETARARMLLEGLTATLAPGVERARALRHLARARAFEEGFIGVMEPLERALAEVGDVTRLRAALERDVAFAIMNIGDVSRAEPHAAAAVAAAVALDDEELPEDARAIHDSVRFLLGYGVPDDLAARARRLALDQPEHDAHPASSRARRSSRPSSNGRTTSTVRASSSSGFGVTSPSAKRRGRSSRSCSISASSSAGRATSAPRRRSHER